MLAKFVVQNLLSPLLKDKYTWGKGKSEHNLDLFIEDLGKGSSIIDIGCGLGFTTQSLIKRGYKVIPVDVINLSILNSVKPIIYDGEKLPFEDNIFDVSLLLSVLHHTKDPVAVLKETKRVSKKIIIIEDVFNNSKEKYLTYIADCITNLEFIGHPHTNKTDKQWQEIFTSIGLKLINKRYAKTWKVFSVVIYVLENK